MEDNNNNNNRRRSDVNTGNANGGRTFTTLEISPDYEDDNSGEFDNDFSSPEHSGRYNRNPRHNRQQGQAVPQHPSRNEGFQVTAEIENNNGVPKHGDYRRQSQTLPSDYRRSHSQDHEDGNVNVGFRGDDATDSNTREILEMRRMEEGGRREQTPREGLHHRRAKSQRLNGYDYYRQLHRRNSLEPEPSPDYESNSLPGHKLTKEGIAQTRHFLATLRVRRKSKKRGSSKREGGGSDAGNEGGGEGGVEDNNDGDNESYEEEIGLPSARGKMKGLAERMEMARELDSASDVVRLYTQRDSIWEVKYPAQAKRKSTFKQTFRSAKDWVSGISYNVNFWSQHFKQIEGQCGIATTTFFRFTRWLIKINFLVFLIFTCFLYVPQFVVWAEPNKNLFIVKTAWNTSSLNDVGLQEAISCSKAYTQYVGNISVYTGIPVVLDIATGTGLLEDTSIFYGRYSNLSIHYKSLSTESGYSEITTDYNMSLAFMLTMIISFLIIFVMIVRTSSQSVRSWIMDLENNAVPSYSNAVFSGWDYCINTEKMAFYKQKITYNIFQAKLEEMEIKRQRQMRTRKQQIKLFVKRFFINLLVLIILGGCFTAIIFTTNFLLETQEKNVGEVQSLLVEYLPSIIISVFNLTIPVIFMVLVEKEEYTPDRSTSLTIIRAVFLRISLVGVLLFSIYYRLFHKRDRELYYCPEEGLSATTSTCCGNPLWKTSAVTTGEEKGSVKCWETYVGQQFYKLAIADFINTCVVYLGYCTLRKVLFSNFKDRVWFISKWGLQRFDLSLEVLDIVYTQTLCWVGMFFAPLLPLFCLVQTFIYFFVKKHILLQLCETPKNTYRASRSYSFFQVVLLVTFTIICIILGYMIGNIQPSKGCGPFRLYSSPDHVMFDAIANEINSWPTVPKGIFNFLGTVGFFLPAFLILALAIYYYWAVSQGYKKLEELLQQQLKSESYDKQYLLAKVDDVIKKGQLNLHDEGW